MIDDFESINENNTWSLTDLSKGHKQIGLKWVFKLKYDEHGEILKYKAWLVARGYVQKQGIDFEKVFAPVATMESVKVNLCLVAHYNWIVYHMDVKSTFLNGDLTEEVYVSQPPGFINRGQEGKVLKLHKALYGLRQAHRAWNAKLDVELKRLGFRKCKIEHGLYTREVDQNILIIGVYVDDLIIMEKTRNEVEAFKKEMKRIFHMSDLGPLSYYLGIKVKQDHEGIWLGQSAYASKLLEKVGMR
jgi:hypothetical protein